MRAVRDNILVKERPDLDPGVTDIIVPDVAKRFGPSMAPDHLCYAEVVSIGPGSIADNKITARAGDIVTFDLCNVSHAYIQQGQGYMVLPQKAIIEIQRAHGYQPILDWVITRQDVEAMAASMSRYIRAPDYVLVDGQRTDSLVDGSMRIVVERVVASGSGRKHSVRRCPDGPRSSSAYDDQRLPDVWVERLDVPQLVPGQLVAFSPSASVRFRRGGAWYRATPWHEMQFTVDDED
jgi:co-chaperonin GroES (HSP10)